MNYMNLEVNDIVNGEGICVSLFVAGCPHHCPGCFNEEAWDYAAGKPFTFDTIEEILKAIPANEIVRNFSLLGGEPLAPPNRKDILKLLTIVRENYPNIQIYLWTGYLYEDLIKEVPEILSLIDILIDGPFILEQKDLTLKLRGSKNQRIIYLKGGQKNEYL